MNEYFFYIIKLIKRRSKTRRVTIRDTQCSSTSTKSRCGENIKKTNGRGDNDTKLSNICTLNELNIKEVSIPTVLRIFSIELIVLLNFDGPKDFHDHKLEAGVI